MDLAAKATEGLRKLAAYRDAMREQVKQTSAKIAAEARKLAIDD